MSHFGAECLDKGSLSRWVKHAVVPQQLIISVCHNLCLCVTEDRKKREVGVGFCDCRGKYQWDVLREPRRDERIR